MTNTYQIDTRDVDKLEAVLAGTARQLPFAVMKTINDTALDFQKAERAHLSNVFDVRRKAFVKLSVKINKFAKKTDLEAQVSIKPPGKSDRSDIFVKFETGGRKSARDGGSIAIPISVRRGATGVIRKGDRPKAFQFHRVGKSWRGRRRTFIIPGVGIFQREGRKRLSTIKLLYLFKKSVPIPASLRFIANAKKIIPRVYPGHFKHRWAQALATAKRRRR